jgi:hypothetical protein
MEAVIAQPLVMPARIPTTAVPRQALGHVASDFVPDTGPTCNTNTSPPSTTSVNRQRLCRHAVQTYCCHQPCHRHTLNSFV